MGRVISFGFTPFTAIQLFVAVGIYFGVAWTSGYSTFRFIVAAPLRNVLGTMVVAIIGGILVGRLVSRALGQR